MFRRVILIVIAASVCAAPLSASAASCTANTSGARITGYAWSETIGWIDLSCQNSGVCGTNPFGLYVDAGGNVTGCAWSENVGWISASPTDLTGCPAGSCTSALSTTAWSGWLRALSPIGDSQNGGWDGWISMSGVSPAKHNSLASVENTFFSAGTYSVNLHSNHMERRKSEDNIARFLLKQAVAAAL